MLGYDDARHLLARTGFGPTDAEIRVYAGMPRDAAVDKLLREARTVATSAPPASATDTSPLRPPRKDSATEERKAFVQTQVREGLALRAWWIEEMAVTRSPLTERMTLFWHNHFVSGQPKVRITRLMYRQNATLRANALGSFGVLLHAIAKDPAMLVYLDSVQNRKGAPNENFAREVMELFTLGEGHYTERDVKEAARAFTGWSVDRETASMCFVLGCTTTGVKTVLGRAGRFDGDAVLRHPARATGNRGARDREAARARVARCRLCGKAGDRGAISRLAIRHPYRPQGNRRATRSRARIAASSSSRRSSWSSVRCVCSDLRPGGASLRDRRGRHGTEPVRRPTSRAGPAARCGSIRRRPRRSSFRPACCARDDPGVAARTQTSVTTMPAATACASTIAAPMRVVAAADASVPPRGQRFLQRMERDVSSVRFDGTDGWRRLPGATPVERGSARPAIAARRRAATADRFVRRTARARARARARCGLSAGSEQSERDRRRFSDPLAMLGVAGAGGRRSLSVLRPWERPIATSSC
jgi:hypothetical protein